MTLVAADTPALRPFRLAVLDVGEPAARVVAAAADLGRDCGAGWQSVLVHRGSTPWFGRDADETLTLDATDADAVEPSADHEAQITVETLVNTLREARIDGVWLGVTPGVDLDRAAFAEACAKAQIAVAGPNAAALTRLADRSAVAAELGLGEARGERARLFDVDLVADATTCLVLPPRDLIAVDDAGAVVVSEFPAFDVSESTVAAMTDATRRLVALTGYTGGGTIRFRSDASGSVELVDVDSLGRADTALLDEDLTMRLLQARLGLLCGQPLPESLPQVHGHAFGASLRACRTGRPQSTGRAGADAHAHRIELLDLPTGIGVRAEAAPRVGDVVGRDGDDVITSLGAWGRDRQEALTRLRRALERTTAVLDGAGTNRSDLIQLAGHPDLAAGVVDEHWYARRSADLEPVTDPIAVVAAAVEAYEADLASVRATFLASAARGRPGRPEEVGSRLTLDYRGIDLDVTVERRSPTTYRIGITQAGEQTVNVDARVDVLGEYERRLSCNGRRYRVVATEHGAAIHLEIDGLAHTITREDGMAVRTPRPALVADLHVAVGDRVSAGQQVATLESMKMLSTITSPYAGVVTSVAVLPNTQVERGATLLRVHSESPATHPGDGARLDLTSLTSTPAAAPNSGAGEGDSASRATDVYRRLRDYLLGYDLSPAALKALLAEQAAVAGEGSAGDARLIAAEDALLDLYTDLASLYRPRTEGDIHYSADPELAGDGVPEGDSVGASPVSADTQEYFLAFVQWLDPDRAGLPQRYRERLARALARYGVEGFTPGRALDEATLWMFRSFARVPALSGAITTVLERRLTHVDDVLPVLGAGSRDRLDRLAVAAEGRAPAVAALARDTAFALFEEPTLQASVEEARRPVMDLLARIADGAAMTATEKADAVRTLYAYPHPLRAQLLQAWMDSDANDADLRDVLLETSLRRYYRQHDLQNLAIGEFDGVRLASADYVHEGRRIHVVTTYSALLDTYQLGGPVRAHLEQAGLLTGPDAESVDVVVGVLSWRRSPIPSLDELAEAARLGLEQMEIGRPLARVDLTVTSRAGVGKEHTRTQHVSFMQDGTGAWIELLLYRNLHPMMAERLDIWRLSNFTLERLASPEDVYLFLGVARENPKDRRLFALVEARDLTRVSEDGRATYPRLQRLALEALAAMRSALATFPPRQRPAANRLIIMVSPPWTVPAQEWAGLAEGYQPLARGVGLEKLVVHVRVPLGGADSKVISGGHDEAVESVETVDKVIYVEGLGRRGLTARLGDPGPNPVRTLTPYAQKVLTAERFGAPYPYEIVRMLTPSADEASSFPRGSFTELDLDESGTRLVPVQRDVAQNSAHLVVGEITTYTDVVPEGMTRVAILSDPTQGLGNLSEPECARINAALDHAREKKLPVEWYAVSSGALIALDSGTENMDWIALTLRRIIEFTQAGGEINIIVTGINVGGQPYWNAEATMLMHTKGILIMTPASQMVLTGKQALDFSGAVSAEDNSGIGGYDRIMGPNGQAQYWAPSFEDACRVLLHHYDYTYVVPGERFPRRRRTMDAADRDVRTSPHDLISTSPFTSVADVFDNNPERKMPFDMRSVMRAVTDIDDEPLERWKHWRDSDTSIVWDATIGGIPVCLLGLESHAVPRTGFVPSDGPPAWTSGTLFPQASRKTARAINASSGNRPLVVLANLSGFDGSPESMRNWQLEYGAEIGRAVTNFDGPIVFVVVSRYHGGAFVVFSKQLNDHMAIAAVEGSRASVIGGAPAAATVFAREVKKRTTADPRVVEASEALKAATGAGVAQARAAWADITARVRSEKLGEMADEFDAIHSVDRALRVGSVDEIIAPADLRPWIISALERGMADFTS